MNNEMLFDKQTALAKIGRRVRTLVAFSGVPKGTTGIVATADIAARHKLSDGTRIEFYYLAIRWELPSKPPVLVRDGNFTFIRTGRPLVDWFTKDEYERFLVEIDTIKT
ncbi:MAG: hypothetical protein HYR76_01135 [Ignavibacteria bacterium]|nr:hypothetical protein [Ignavibacteria bacterium]